MKKSKKIWINTLACLFLAISVGGFAACKEDGKAVNVYKSGNDYIYNGVRYTYQFQEYYNIKRPTIANSVEEGMVLIGYTDSFLDNREVYMAEYDVEENILLCKYDSFGSYSNYYIKEGFQFPNILEAELMKITLYSHEKCTLDVDFKLNEVLSNEPIDKTLLPRLLQKMELTCELAICPAYKNIYLYTGDWRIFITVEKYAEEYYEVVNEEFKGLLNI